MQYGSGATRISGYGLAALALALSGCEGSIAPSGLDPALDEDMVDGPAGGNNGNGTGTPGNPDEPGACVREVLPGAAVPMRRLTRGQIERTLSDVLGVSEPVAVSDETIFAYPSNISSPIDESAAQAYLDMAEKVVNRVSLTSCTAAGCKGWLLDDIGRRLFRRPLEGEQRQRYQALFDAGLASEGTPAAAAKWVLQAMIQSPAFLYLDEPVDDGGYLDGYAVAGRLALTFWGSNPDDALLDAAGRGDFDGAAGIRDSVKSMLADSRSQRGLAEFVTGWLETRRLRDINARPDLLALGTNVLAAMESEPGQVFRSTVKAGGSFADLFAGSSTVSMPDLKAIYGNDILSTVDGESMLDPLKRAGMLTLPGVSAGLAHAGATSPTLRGHAILANVLCTPPPAPPAGIDATLPAATATSTTRARLEAHFESPSCSGCHRSMDGLGFAFENFDAVGKWRDLDNGQPVDATAQFDLGDQEFTVKGAVELSQVLATQGGARECFAQQWTQYAAGIPDSTKMGCFRSNLADALAQPNGLENLMVELAASDYLRKGVSP